MLFGVFRIDNLGRHPIGSPNECRTNLFRRSCNLYSQSKVGNLDNAFFGEHDIESFEVSVRYTPFVQICHAIQDLSRVEGDKIFR